MIRNLLSKIILTGTLIAILLVPNNSMAQETGKDSFSPTREQQDPAVVTNTKPVYPKVVGYLSFIVPVVTVNSAATYNFTNTTSIGFPVGVNVLYSDRFGFSYEFTPTIKGSENTSKVSNLLFDPGPMFRFKHGFTIITRLAFETEGRYGFTPVFNQVYLRTKDVNYFVAFSLPARFGDNEAPSIGLNVQFGFIFN